MRLMKEGWGVARSAAALILALLVGCGGSGGGGAAPLAQVMLLDASGIALTSLPAGSKVMIDGEEIPNSRVRLLSDPPADPAPAGPSSLTLYVPGYGGFDQTALNPAAGVTVQLIQRSLLDGLHVFAPTPGRVLVGDPGLAVGSRSFCVQGISTGAGAAALRFDVVLLIDRSASTSRDSGIDLDGGGNETVLQVQCESLRRYIDALRGSVQIGVIAFDRFATVYQPLTDDKAVAKAALDVIEAAGSTGPTDYREGILAAESLLTTDPNRTTILATLEDVNGIEVEQEVAAPRVVILCSDGVPTLPMGSSLTQEAGDRLASLQAARDVVDNRIVVNGVAFGPEAAISTLTTLPAVAAITGGVYIKGDDFLELAADPTIFGFADVIGVKVWNTTLEGPADAAFSPDGLFDRPVPWTFGVNRIAVQLVTREAALSVTHEFDVRVVRPSEAGVDALVLNGAFVPLEPNNLRTPDGKQIGGPTLKHLLLNGSFEQFNDLYELKGLETVQPLTAAPVTVQVYAEFAGYASDFGFVEFDPAAPAATAHALLTNGTAITLGNSGSFGPSSNLQIFSTANAATTFSAALTPGRHYAFWVIPNGTLAAYQANAKSTNAPLLTITQYNPARGDHFLTYQSENGRIGAGQGRTLVLALEDISKLDQSDRDYNDLVFTILAPATDLAPEFAAAKCP